MFTITEKCTLKPLAAAGPFKREFVVAVSFNIFKMGDGAKVLLSCIDDDGLEKKVAEGRYMLDPDVIKKMREKLAEKEEG